MKAVILSAGQGKRLLPHTADKPKCTVPVNGLSIVEWQVQELLEVGIDSIRIIVGFGADKVEALLANHIASGLIRTLYNPFYALADNLMSCWVARQEMTEDFVLINGDTLFESSIIEGLLAAPPSPITLVTDKKTQYDADDMKVIVQNGQLIRVGKTLPLHLVNGESIGMMRFQLTGPQLFCAAIDSRIRKPEALKQWYLSLIDELAQQGHVSTYSIQGSAWAEVDSPSDLTQAESLFKERKPMHSSPAGTGNPL